MRLFSSHFFSLLFSPCHKHTHTHTHIHTSSFPSSFMIYSTVVVSACAAFDIHGYACSSRICVCVCVLKKGCSLRPSFIPLSFLPCLFFTFYVPYIHTYIHIYICIHWYIDRFFLHLHSRQHCVC